MSPWDDHTDYPVADWQAEVLADDTRLGYVDWRCHKIEAAGTLTVADAVAYVEEHGFGVNVDADQVVLDAAKGAAPVVHPVRPVAVTLWDGEGNVCDSLSTTSAAAAVRFASRFLEAHAFDPDHDVDDVARQQMAGSITWRIG